MDKLKKMVDDYIQERIYSRRSGTINWYQNMKYYHFLLFDELKLVKVKHLMKLNWGKYVEFYQSHTRCKNATINSIFKNLRAILKEHKIELWGGAKDKLEDDTKHFDVVEIDDVRKSIAFLQSYTGVNHQYYYAMLLLLFSTGLRRKELLELKISDICFKDRSVKPSHTKTHHENRITFIPECFINAIEEYVNSIKNFGEYVLFNPEKGRRSNVEDIRYMFKLCKKHVGIKSMSSHMIRKSFATFVYVKKKDIYSVSKMLGHSNIKTTMIYIGLDQDQLKDAYDTAFEDEELEEDTKEKS